MDTFTVTLSIGTDTYSVVGDTILDALKQIQPTNFGKTFATVQIEHKGKVTKHPIRIFPTKLSHIFSKPWELELFAKRLTTLL